MNRNVIKYIAVAAMLIDHLALVFVGMDNQLGIIMRVVGRLTAPIMCYFLVEGFIYTRSKKKYGTRLFVFAVVSQIPFIYLVAGYFWVLKLNMIVTLFVCFLILLCLEKIDNIPFKVICVLCLAALCHYCDWGTVAPLWVIVFYIFRDDRQKKCLFYSLVCLFWVVRCSVVNYQSGGNWYGALWQAGSFAFIPFIYLYNGEAGKNSKFSKWFFYWFYPVHLLILGVIYRNVLPLL